MRTTGFLATLTLSAAALAFATQATHAENLRLAPGTPPAHPGHTPLITSFQDQLAEKTGNRMTGNILGTEVANLGNMRNAVTSGLADAGMFLPAYFPSDLPEINLVGDLSFQGTNSQAMGAAMTDYIVNCADCQENLKSLGIVYTSSHASDLYQLLTTEPVSGLDDMRGLRLRAGNPQYARWASAMGASPSNTSVGETFVPARRCDHPHHHHSPGHFPFHHFSCLRSQQLGPPERGGPQNAGRVIQSVERTGNAALGA